MDPNTTLEVLRQAARYDGPLPDADRAELLRENFQVLDEWLSRGGYLPSAWDRPGAPRRLPWKTAATT